MGTRKTKMRLYTLVSSRRHATPSCIDHRHTGNRLLARDIIHHVTHEHAFKDAPLYYRFAVDEPGYVPVEERKQVLHPVWCVCGVV